MTWTLALSLLMAFAASAQFISREAQFGKNDYLRSFLGGEAS